VGAGSNGAAIITEDLTKVYRGSTVPAVDGLNLAVRPGEIFGLLGPNGAGKTTTAGMLTTRVVPTSGRAFVAGVDVVAHPARAKQQTGIVSQQNTLDRQLTVWENLYLHGRLFGINRQTSRRIADDLLARFQLSHYASASVYALSGGMAQRLMVARAIFHRPAVLFLDEPTAGLDPQSRLALWDMLGELHRGGQTIVLTTHNMDEADRLCERIAIIDQGRIAALDTPTALKERIGADTLVSVRADTDPDTLARVLKQALPAMSDSRPIDGGVEASVTATPNLVATVVNAVEAAGHAVTDLSVAAPTLETVFIRLTGKELREK
jgi:ABC-2 type transport system ATP-binding protein